MHGRLERAATIDLRGFFRTLSADVLAQLRRAGTPAVAVPEIFEPSRWRQPFNAAMLPNWNRALWTAVELERVWIETGDAGRQAVRQIAAVDPDNPTPPPSIHVDPSPEQLRKFREFLKARSAGVWNQVGATTHKLLERTITRGIREGLTFDQMQAHVQATLKSYSDTQARRVARTETTGSIGYGGQVERDEAGIEFKEWISRLDERTRTYAHGSADHLAANGLVVGNAESFQVSGEPLMFPGDAAGSAANIINCRCSAVASLGDGRKRRRPAPVAPVAPRPEPVPAPPPPPAAKPKGDFPERLASLKVLRRLGGSTGAELVEDEFGRQFVRKFGATPEHIREEFAAEQAYRRLGVAVPEARLYEEGGRPAKLSKFIDGTPVGDLTGDQLKAAISSAEEGYAADALLANWDVAGLSGDNVLVDKAGKLWRVDVGGSLRYRAQGAAKASGWSGWPEEFWTLAERPDGSARRLFGATSYDRRLRSLRATLGRLDSAEKRKAFLEVLPDEIRATVGKRIDNLHDTLKHSDIFLKDGWRSDYVGEVMKHRMGLRKSGIIDGMADELKLPRKGSVRPLDKAGRPFDGLRGADGIGPQIVDYVNSNGGKWEILDQWASDQASNSWYDGSRALKAFVARQRKGAHAYWWGINGTHAQAEAALKKWFASYTEDAYARTFSIQHALNYSMLQRIKFTNNNIRRGVITLLRTEEGAVMRRLYGVKTVRGQTGSMLRGAAESFSVFHPEFIGAADTITRQVVPHTRVLGSYFFGRGPQFDWTFFLRDKENEFIVVPDGISFVVTGFR